MYTVVCVAGGSLTWPGSGGLVWGWVRLHTCGAVANQVKPAITTHTHTHTRVLGVPPALSAMATNSALRQIILHHAELENPRKAPF